MLPEASAHAVLETLRGECVLLGRTQCGRDVTVAGGISSGLKDFEVACVEGWVVVSSTLRNRMRPVSSRHEAF
jgi:hypothetical protein